MKVNKNVYEDLKEMNEELRILRKYLQQNLTLKSHKEK